MHIVHSKINTNLQSGSDIQNEDEIMVRFLAYQETCEKYRNEIIKIQKYIPGWVPKFRS